MIIADNGREQAVTIFFPGAVAGGRTFHARRLAAVKRGLGFKIGFQLLLIGASFVQIPWVLSTSSPLTLAYTIWKVWSSPMVALNARTQHLRCSLAPFGVWLDHVSFFGMLLCGILRSSNYLRPPYDGLDMLAWPVAILCLFLGLAPLWSWHVLRQRNRAG